MPARTEARLTLPITSTAGGRFPPAPYLPYGLVTPYAYAVLMRTISVTRARQQLYRLLNEVAESSEPVQIQGPRTDAVLVSADDWRAIQETLYLSSIPGMADSIVEGLKTPLEDCVDEPEW